MSPSKATLVTYGSGSLGSTQGRATVQANRSPDMTFPFAPDGCRDMDTFGIAFFARVSDENIDTVTLTINGAGYAMQSSRLPRRGPAHSEPSKAARI